MSLCALSLEHHDVIRDIQKAVGLDPWSYSLLSNLFMQNVKGYYCHEKGYLFLRVHDCEIEILSLAVYPQYQKRGIAFQMMMKMFDDFKGKDFCLEVAENNMAALNLYEKCGFERAGLRKNYYRAGDKHIDGVLMACRRPSQK